jgi:hypothetical protein
MAPPECCRNERPRAQRSDPAERIGNIRVGALKARPGSRHQEQSDQRRHQQKNFGVHVPHSRLVRAPVIKHIVWFVVVVEVCVWGTARNSPCEVELAPPREP